MQVREADRPAFCGRLLGCEGDLEGEQTLGTRDRGSAVTLNGVEEGAEQDLIEVIAAVDIDRRTALGRVEFDDTGGVLIHRVTDDDGAPVTEDLQVAGRRGDRERVVCEGKPVNAAGAGT